MNAPNDDFDTEAISSPQGRAILDMVHTHAFDRIAGMVTARVFDEWKKSTTTSESRDRLYYELQALERVSREFKMHATAFISAKRAKQ